jgi:hypothetical protein
MGCKKERRGKGEGQKEFCFVWNLALWVRVLLFYTPKMIKMTTNISDICIH